MAYLGHAPRLAFEDRGRGTGLWMAAFFGGEFVCPLVLIAVEAGVGSLAGAVGCWGWWRPWLRRGCGWQPGGGPGRSIHGHCRSNWAEAIGLKQSG